MTLPAIEKPRGVRPQEVVPCVWDDNAGTFVPVSGQEDGSINVTVVNAETPVELTGDVMLDTFGALDDAKVVNPDAASATVPALLRGNLVQTLAIKLSAAGIVTATEATQAAAEALQTALADPATETTLAALLAIVGTAGDDHEDATVMGVLTRIAVGVEALAS